MGQSECSCACARNEELLLNGAAASRPRAYQTAGGQLPATSGSRSTKPVDLSLPEGGALQRAPVFGGTSGGGHESFTKSGKAVASTNSPATSRPRLSGHGPRLSGHRRPSGGGRPSGLRISTTSTHMGDSSYQETPTQESESPTRLCPDSPEKIEKRHSNASALSSSAQSLFSGAPSCQTLNTQYSSLMESDTDVECSSCETDSEPPAYSSARRAGMCFGTLDKHVFEPPRHEKDDVTSSQLRACLKACCIFGALSSQELEDLVDTMSIEQVTKGKRIVRQGDMGDALFVILSGHVDCFQEEEWSDDDSYDLEDSGPPQSGFVATRSTGALFGELSVISNAPRLLSVYAGESCRLGRLESTVYHNLVVQRQFRKRERHEECLKRAKLLELLSDEQVAKLADAMSVRIYDPGEVIIGQGEEGEEFFILQTGECVATVRTFDDVQEVRRYFGGENFGELALLENAKRAATVAAVTEVEAMRITRGSFERMLGPLSMLQRSQYLNDPRKLIADFYRPGDYRGPRGTLDRLRATPDLDHKGPSQWFAVFRPTSRDAIAKMLGGHAVGKGLNVKGKSAKKNRLSGFVPFVQIMNNEDKALVERETFDRRIRIFYKTQAAREAALAVLSNWRKTICKSAKSGIPFNVMRSASPGEFEASDFMLDASRTEDDKQDLSENDCRVLYDDTYVPQVYGLNLPALLVQEAYIMQPDLSPPIGWETGRSSEPAFMDMNMNAVCAHSDPETVLYQHDEGNPMNPWGLLIAYAEKSVKPVVSDFDAFLIASRGMTYEPLPKEQCDLMSWSLSTAQEILDIPSDLSWTVRWLTELKRKAENGFHPRMPRYGFGDPTSYRLIDDIVTQTESQGAVRHGAECFNFYFPQELDDNHLVIWEGFSPRPWEYMNEGDLRSFLIERVAEGYSFPLNPVWPIRDPAWYEVWTALRNSASAHNNLAAWYPPESGVVQKVEQLHKQYPDGFCQDIPICSTPHMTTKRSSAVFTSAPSIPALIGSFEEDADTGARFWSPISRKSLKVLASRMSPSRKSRSRSRITQGMKSFRSWR